MATTINSPNISVPQTPPAPLLFGTPGGGAGSVNTPPPPLPQAASLPPRLMAVALEQIPDWFGQIGAITVLSAKVIDVDAAGVTRLATEVGELRFTPNAPLPVDSSVKLLIEQKPIAQVTVLNDYQMPPPIRFPGESNNDTIHRANWPALIEGDFLAAQIMAMPPTPDAGLTLDAASGLLASQHAAHLAENMQDVAAQIRAYVAEEANASTIFLSSLLGQTAPPILQQLLQESDKAGVAAPPAPILVTPHAISTSTNGVAAPVTLLPDESPPPFLASHSPAQAPAAPPVTAALGTAASSSLLPLPPQLVGSRLGQQIQVQLVSILPPHVPSAPSTPGPPVTPPSATPNLAAAAVPPPQNPPADAPAASTASTTSTASNLLPGLVSGTVIGVDGQGQTVVAIGPVLITLPVSPPPIQSQIILAWNVTIPVPSSENILSEDLVGWISKLLFTTIGTGAESPLAAAFPRLGNNLAAHLALYVQAADRRDFRALIAATTEAIIDGKPDAKQALEQIRHNFAAQISGATEETGTPWRSFTLPLLVPIPSGGHPQLHPIKFFLRGANPESEHEKNAHRRGGAPGVRFLVDLDLSRLGSLQLDGLAREKRLDLVIRSAIPLADPVRQEIGAIFTRVADAYGLQGQTSFQVAPKFIPPMDSKPVARPLPKLTV